MKKLTVEQGIILTGYTGFLLAPMNDYHKAVEEKLGRPIWTHQFADKKVVKEIKEAFAEDFMAIMPEGSNTP